MKKVFSDARQVAHLFAHQTQDEATNTGRTFYFQGNTIYSYGGHFPIARHYNGVLLFTKRGYSNTTSKHISITLGATSHIKRVYCYHPNGTTFQNFELWSKDIDAALVKMSNARKPEKYVSEILALINQATEYAELMGVDVPERITNMRDVTDTKEAKELLAKRAEQEAIEQEKNRKLQEALHKKQLKKWKAGIAPSVNRFNDIDWLRVRNGMVQTSQGINVSMQDAMMLQQNIDRLTVGSKALDWTVVEKDKTYIRIGCHRFKISYLKKFYVGNDILQEA